MLKPVYDWTFRRVVWATCVFVASVVSLWLIYYFNQVIFTIIAAIILGTVIRPLVSFLYAHGVPRLAGNILAYLLPLVLFTGFGFLLFPLITNQGGLIINAIPGYYLTFRDWMMASSNPLILQLSEFLPLKLSVPNLDMQSGTQMLESAGQGLGYVISVVHFIFSAIIFLLLAFFWTLNGPRIIQSLMLLIPKDRRESYGELVLAMETKVGFYIAGQGVLCLIVGSMAFVAYLLIGLPNALVLALIAGVLEAVPMIGPLLGAFPAAAVALSIAPSKMVWVIIASIVIQQVENSVLVPRVMRKAVGVNPFVSLLSIFAFSSFFGIGGALMAIPIAATIQLILDRFVFNTTAMESETSPERGPVSRLRYEAQDLAQDLRKQARIKKGGSDLRVKQIDEVMDEIETITTDLDALLGQVHLSGVP
jgi:predicted PurR-regulated permease PerM